MSQRAPKEIVTLNFHCKLRVNIDDIISNEVTKDGKKQKVENTIEELANYFEEEFYNAQDALDWFHGILELTIEKGKQKRHIEFDMNEKDEVENGNGKEDKQ